MNKCALEFFNNKELQFFEKAFVAILLKETRMRELSSFYTISDTEDLNKLTTLIDEFTYIYKEFINGDAVVLDRNEMTIAVHDASELSALETVSFLSAEYDNWKAIISEHKESGDKFSDIFMIVAEDVFNYAIIFMNKKIISNTDHTEKFNNWIRMLSDDIM